MIIQFFKDSFENAAPLYLMFCIWFILDTKLAMVIVPTYLLGGFGVYTLDKLFNKNK